MSGIISTGFCGALDPALRLGDIVISGAAPRATPAPFATGEILSIDRVAITAAEKRKLYAGTGAIAVEMEAAAVRQKAADWSVPFYCIKSVSDVAADDMPLDFNLYREAQGRFARSRIALAALSRPFTVAPALLRLNRNCSVAADALGEFLANCRF